MSLVCVVEIFSSAFTWEANNKKSTKLCSAKQVRVLGIWVVNLKF
jgi:hypothetical protein